MLELPNFGQMATSAIQFESRDKALVVMSWAGIMTSQPSFQKTVVLGRPGVAIVAEIIKIITIFI